MSEQAHSPTTETDLPFVYEDGDGNGVLFARGHVDRVAFVEGAKRFWADTTGDMEGWEDHYGEMEPEDVEHRWWVAETDDDDCERGRWVYEPEPRAEPFTVYRP